jgi:Tol biopolymer transport system component
MPDGKLVSYYYLGDDVWGLAIVPVEDGKPLQKFPLPASVISRFVRWTPDGKALAYIDTRDGASNIWLQPLDKSTPRQLTNFNAEHTFYFDWSRDGKNSLSLAAQSQLMWFQSEALNSLESRAALIIRFSSLLA